MKKLVNAGLKSKKEAAQALIDGRQFEFSHRTIYFNPECQNPFRCGINELSGFWDIYSVWQEEKEIPWYEDIPKEGVICWVLDDPYDEYDESRHLDRIKKYKAGNEWEFKGERSSWDNAEPVKPEECYQGVSDERD